MMFRLVAIVSLVAGPTLAQPSIEEFLCVEMPSGETRLGLRITGLELFPSETFEIRLQADEDEANTQTYVVEFDSWSGVIVGQNGVETSGEAPERWLPGGFLSYHPWGEGLAVLSLIIDGGDAPLEPGTLPCLTFEGRGKSISIEPAALVDCAVVPVEPSTWSQLKLRYASP